MCVLPRVISRGMSGTNTSLQLFFLVIPGSKSEGIESENKDRGKFNPYKETLSCWFHGKQLVHDTAVTFWSALQNSLCEYSKAGIREGPRQRVLSNAPVEGWSKPALTMPWEVERSTSGGWNEVFNVKSLQLEVTCYNWGLVKSVIKATIQKVKCYTESNVARGKIRLKSEKDVRQQSSLFIILRILLFILIPISSHWRIIMKSLTGVGFQSSLASNTTSFRQP